ncbi:MAG: type II toxin-antitoxin system VapC family toxin [Bdellovibrionales bacterium]
MKSLLLDTHIFVPCFLYPERIHRDIFQKIDSADICCFSVINLIEIMNLRRKGTLDITYSISEIIDAAKNDLRFHLLDIEAQDIETLENLPFLKTHKDPNDRMLIAQAKARGLTVVTADRKFLDYDVDVLLSDPV